MTEKRLSIPECVKRSDGQAYNQIIRHHCLAGNLSHEKQNGHIFIKESDFEKWLEKYLANAFPIGPKPIIYNYDAKPDAVVIAKA